MYCSLHGLDLNFFCSYKRNQTKNLVRNMNPNKGLVILVLDTIKKRICSNVPFFCRGGSVLSGPYKWCPNEPPLQIHL
jgi:hypothetical protein